MTDRLRFRILLTAAVVLSWASWFGASQIVGIPVHVGFEASLLQQPNVGSALLLLMVLFPLTALLGAMVVRREHFPVAILTAAAGLSALTFRGGPMRCVLQAASGPGVYLMLASELLLLYALLAGCWGLLVLARGRRLIPPEEHATNVSTNLPAIGVHAVVTAVLMLLVVRSDMKLQAVAGVGAAALIGSLAAHALFPSASALLHWVSPLLVGLVGYLWAYSNPGPWIIGQAANRLARVLPLDYASAGTVGALLGLWISRGWERDRQAEAKAA